MQERKNAVKPLPKYLSSPSRFSLVSVRRTTQEIPEQYLADAVRNYTSSNYDEPLGNSRGTFSAAERLAVIAFGGI